MEPIEIVEAFRILESARWLLHDPTRPWTEADSDADTILTAALESVDPTFGGLVLKATRT